MKRKQRDPEKQEEEEKPVKRKKWVGLKEASKRRQMRVKEDEEERERGFNGEGICPEKVY